MTRPPPIGRQIRLPWTLSIGMAYRGIRVEYRRSLLTVATIVCALAFLSFVRTQAAVLNSLRVAARQDVNLARQLALTGQMEAGPAELQRGRILVAMSLLICTVGIGNAMMMSVTERFQQIGTMKCLGALDSFIVRLFVLEGLIFGLAGGLAGAILGTAMAVLREAARFGLPAISLLPWGELARGGGHAVIVAAVISLLGGLYPAIAAARTQPVDAMRLVP